MINKVVLVGRLTRDAEVKSMNNGKEVALFSLATSESYKDKQTGERKNIPEYHSIVVYNEGLIGIIKKYIHKGSLLYVEGSLKTRKWTDKQGVDKYKTEIILANYKGVLKMLDSKGSNNSQTQNNNPQKTTTEEPKERSDTDSFIDY